MIIPVDKEKVINEFKAKYVENRYEAEVSKIYERFNGNKEERKDNIKEEIINNFKKLCSYSIELQKKGLKGVIQFIHISYLRTSLMENRGIYRIDIYDDRWFVDKEECYTNLNLDFIFQSLFSHISELEQHKKEYGRTITEMDIERIKLKEADKYNDLAIKIFKSMIDDFIECDEYKDMKKHEEIMILAGEYKDEAILLYESN